MQAPRLDKVFNRIKYDISPARKLKNKDGPEGRLRKIQKTLTALIKYERIELNYPRADETRGYAELLIQEALRYGPTNKETMELANFWLIEKQLVHKLFKVLIPRYQNCTTTYTKLHMAPSIYPATVTKRAVLELRGNIYPPIEQYNPNKHNLLHNVLLHAARKEYEETKKQTEKNKEETKEGMQDKEENEIKAKEAEIKDTKEGEMQASKETQVEESELKAEEVRMKGEDEKEGKVEKKKEIETTSS